MKFIDNWLAQRRQRAITRSFKNGYDYAAGALLRREKTPADLENEADTSSAFGEGPVERGYDTGITSAVNRLVQLGVVRDNRSYAQ